MKIFVGCAVGSLLTLSSICLAQVDIYQSDAYSVEEMCARQAAQDDQTDYAEAYESCLEQNRENPMYQSDEEAAE